MKLLVKQDLDQYCKVESLNVGHGGSKFPINQQGLLVSITLVDESLQIVALTLFQAQIVYLAHHFFIVGHSRQRRMYDAMRYIYR